MRTFISASLLIAFSTVAAQAQYARDFGVGVNSATGALMGNCVAFRRPETSILPRTMAFTLEYLEDVEKLRQSLDISATASYKGTWGGVDAKTDFFRSVSLNSYSLFMLLKGEIKSDFVALLDPALQGSARVSPTTSLALTPTEFFDQCGDEYIHAVRYGGSVYGLLVINTSSLDEKQRLSAELKGSVNVGFAADASVRTTFSRLLERTNYHIEYFQEGGSTASLPASFSTIDQFFDYAKAIEATLLHNPAVLGVKTKSYRTLDGTLSTAPPHTQRSALRRLARLEAKVSQRLLDVEAILSEPWRFVSADPALLQSERDALDGLSERISDLGEDCYYDQSLCVVPSIDSLERSWTTDRAKLPAESPLYKAIYYSDYRAVPRHVRRNTNCAPRNSYEDFFLTSRLGSLRFLGDGRLHYALTCERSRYFYNCDGGNDHRFESNIDTCQGFVTAKVSVSNGLIAVTDVAPQGTCEPLCYQELVRHLKALNETPLPPSGPVVGPSLGGS